MLNILLFILKAAGILIAVVLGILLAVLLLALFIPIGYRIDISKDNENINAQLSARWILKLLSVNLVKDKDGKQSLDIRILGKKKDFSKKDKTSISKSKEDNKEDNIEEDKEASKESLEGKIIYPQVMYDDDEENTLSEGLNMPENVDNNEDKVSLEELDTFFKDENNFDNEAQKETGVLEKIYLKVLKIKDKINEKIKLIIDKIKTVIDKIKLIINKIKAAVEKIKNIKENIKKKIEGIFAKLKEINRKKEEIAAFIKDDVTKRVFKNTYTQLIKLAKHILPSIKGTIIFGTGDGYSTGQIFSYIGCFYYLFGDKVCIQADFLEKRFDCTLHTKGRIRGITVLYRVLKVILNKDFRILCRNLKKLLNTVKG